MLTLRHQQNKKGAKPHSEDHIQTHNKLLLERFPYNQTQFNFIEIPTMEAPKDFFDNPFKIINDLYAKNFQKIGIVKLILPTKVDENHFFETLRQKLKGKRLDTRTQSIQNMKSGNAFGSNIKGYSLDEYIRYANQFQHDYKLQGIREVSNDLRQQEIEFWSIVDHPEQYEEVEVEYAADLLATKYATGFEEEQHGNLNSVSKNTDSIFQVLTEKNEMSGISLPWLYLGMKYSNFCWHCEDVNLNSLNYMHAGAPKTWYAIPPPQSKKFREYFDKCYEEQLKHNPKLLYDITCQISPIELMENNIQVLRTDQKPGELILTLGETFHAGFSHGLNCSEAVNIAPINWLGEYERAVEEYRNSGNHKKVSFPLEWLLAKIANQSQTVKFTKNGWYKLSEKWQTIIEKEKQFRKQIISIYEKVTIIEYLNKNEKYDRNVCKICSNYMFLSYLYCTKCLKKGCTHHQSVCGCIDPKITMYVRYTDDQLNEMLDLMIRKSK